jgi:hypothetical protein
MYAERHLFHEYQIDKILRDWPCKYGRTESRAMGLLDPWRSIHGSIHTIDGSGVIKLRSHTFHFGRTYIILSKNISIEIKFLNSGKNWVWSSLQQFERIYFDMERHNKLTGKVLLSEGLNKLRGIKFLKSGANYLTF